MHNRITNHQKINDTSEHISCSDIHQISPTYNKTCIYNLDVNHPLQKFWFFLKEVKIIGKKQKSIDIVLSNSISDKKFIEYINNLDDKINKIINKKKKHNTNFSVKKSYSVKELFPYIFNFNIINAQFFDESNKSIQYSEINFCENTTGSILIELSDILISDDEYWINYSIKQMKIKKHIFTESIFDMLDDIHNSPILNDHNTIKISHPFDITHKSYQKNIPSPPPAPKFTKDENSLRESMDKYNSRHAVYDNDNINNNKKESRSNDANFINGINANEGLAFVISTDVLKKQLEKFKQKKYQRITTENHIIVETDMNIKIIDMKKKLEEFSKSSEFINKKYGNITLEHYQ